MARHRSVRALASAILVVGVIWSFVLAAVAARRSGWSTKAYLVLRQAFGGTLLLGLEVLVAADLVRTVAVAPTLDNVLVLGLIVVIRTVLSFSLETEIEGVAPWRRALMGGAGTIRRAPPTRCSPRRRALIPMLDTWTNVFAPHVTRHYAPRLDMSWAACVLSSVTTASLLQTPVVAGPYFLVVS
jgi:uncharacterized membrane protein